MFLDKYMAKANTFEMERGGFDWDKRGCSICGKTPTEYRGFYNPTYFNGDAEWLGDFCKEHKGVDLKKVQSGEIKTLYFEDCKKSW